MPRTAFWEGIHRRLHKPTNPAGKRAVLVVARAKSTMAQVAKATNLLACLEVAEVVKQVHCARLRHTAYDAGFNLGD